MNRISTFLTTAALMTLPAFAQAEGRGAQMFDRLDANADGQVTTAEVTAQKTESFAAADTDANGLLDAAERGAMRERSRRHGGDGLRGDTDGDGNLSLAEFTAMNPLFDRADADGDGVVTRAEFDAAPRHHRP